MKKISLVLGVIIGCLLFTSCSKGDCICNSTTTVGGVITSSSSTTNSLDSGVPGPLGSVEDEDCDSGDSFYSNTDFNGEVTENRTECELE